MPEEEKRERLAKVIRHWNNNRLDLFEISQPDENLDFHGVMRFYFEDHLEGNVSTKCLRVCSNSTTLDVIDVLWEKFRPDMKMLTTSYSLYEIDGKKERKLEQEERPLIVQLNWNSDQREERFVLKRDKESFQEKENSHEKEKEGMIQKFKRTLSRKEKKSKIKADRISDNEDWSTAKPRSMCVSDCDTADCTEDKRHQWQNAPGVRLTGSLYHDFPGLPFGIEFSDNSEDAFLSAVINYTNSSTVHFKLSPAFILYAAAHFALRHQHYRRGSTPSGQKHSVISITNKMVAMTEKVIQRQESIAGALAFWMANSSELLNFFKHDKELRLLTQQSQLDLSHLVHRAYRYLLQCLQNELAKHLPTFLIDPEQHGPLPAGIELVLNTLMNTMSLLSRHRVNPTLTIQLFSRLFHFISIWLFNQLMSPEADAPGLRSHYWGAALRQRLTAIEAWAERHGLELAADVHLGHIIQATTLLTMNKYSMRDVKDIQNTCFKLNSLQLKMLLTGYLYANTEPYIPPDLIDAVVTSAKASADNLILSEGRDIQLEESQHLCLPFLLPEGGYSCDTVRGIPPGLQEFLEPICQKGLCSLTSEPNSKGDWTIYFHEDTPPVESTYLAAHREPEIVTITLRKPLNSGMGLSIVSAKGAEQGYLGIYIKNVVKGGPADMNGLLKSGDQLLSVDGQSLVGLSQERAAAILVQTGPVVTLKVAKFGASYHGLGALLGEPAPERITGDKSFPQPNGKAFELYSAVEPGPLQQLHERSSSRWKKEQIMQRNRQLYRSDPNMTTDLCLEDGDEPVDPVVRGNNIAAVSSINLCTDTFHRDYSTLPNPKLQDKNKSESSRPQQTFESLRPLGGKSSSEKIYVAAHREPEIMSITLRKPLNSGMGLSIVSAKGAEQGNLGVYIKSVVKGGPAEMNGVLKAGDQLLSVDGQSLVGLSQERAAAIMWRAGPVVTLTVAKFGESYHGLGALLGEPAPERITGDKSFPQPNGKAFELYSAVEPGPCQQLHERSSSRLKKEQIMQRNRQLYRSDPNMTTDLCLEDGDEPVDPVVRGNNIAAVSSINLCTDTCHRDYSTLPNPKSLSNNISESSRPQQTFESSRPLDGKSSSKKMHMRQALSQENLCVDSRGPLLDKRWNTCEQQGGSAKQTTSHYSSFPIRSCVSTHDILSDNSSPASGAGVWRTPFSQHSTSTLSVQPRRIDVPLTRAANTQPNPPLVTFHSPPLLSMKMSQTLEVNGHHQRALNQVNNIYACPIPASEKLPQPSLSSQQHRSSMFRGQAVKPQVNTTPKKQVSFQEPPTQQKQGTATVKYKDTQGPSEPRRRETQEKQEKQQRLPALELLKHTVQELQAKVKRSVEENERLGKLRLEWQFQKRLQEIQQRGDDKDEDFDMMVTIQQLDTSAQISGGNINSELKELDQLTGNPVPQKADKINIAQRPTGLTENVHSVGSKENREEKIQSTAAPEKLTFKERQRLFLSSA